MADASDLIEEMFRRYEGWELRSLERIGKELRRTRRLTQEQAQQVNNLARAKESLAAVQKDLARITGMNIEDLNRIYGNAIASAHRRNISMYDFRGIQFIPYEDNPWLQSLARSYARSTAETMLNLSKTSSLGFTTKNGRFVPAEKGIYDALGKTSLAVNTGVTDVQTAIRDAILELGDSGLRVSYDGITRRLDSVVRQNVLYTVKQAHQEYQSRIGEELGCDGIEIDWHSNPRPSHEFMQGRQFAKGGDEIVNGQLYPGAETTRDPETGVNVYEALDEYGCLHYSTEIILGISAPRYDQEELAELNAENEREIEIDGTTHTGYEWKQTMRALETEMRKAKREKALAEGAFDQDLVADLNRKLSRYESKYRQIGNAAGIKPQMNRADIIRPLTG